MIKGIKNRRVIVNILVLVIVFIAGFFANGITGFSVYQAENSSNGTYLPIEKATPGDWVSEEKIKVYEDKVVLNIKGAEWSRFRDSGSMEPVFGSKSNAIEVKPKNSDEVKIGDIVAYNSSFGTIIHRVTEKGIDDQGIYFIMKGDNNPTNDPEKVRFKQIERVLIAIIY